MNNFREVAKRISPYMRSKGFVLSGKHYYHIVNDIAYCIGFDKPSGLLYTTAYIMPLFIPCDSRYYTYGNRLSAIHDIRLPILSTDDAAEIDAWCSLLCNRLEQNLIPFFDEIGTPRKLLDFAETYQYSPASYIACHEIYIWRLKMYMYLEIGELSKVRSIVAHYREMLKGTLFFTDHVRQKFIDEADLIESLIEKPKEKVTDFCSQIVDSTRKYL